MARQESSATLIVGVVSTVVSAMVTLVVLVALMAIVMMIAVMGLKVLPMALWERLSDLIGCRPR